jgi:SAM-dependent methyltransferase
MALDPASVRASYDRVAWQYAEAFDDELSQRPLERALLGALPELAGLGAWPGIVADLGAGPAHVARHLRGAEVPTIAVDLAPAMAAVAHRRNHVPSAAGSLTALPLAAGSLTALPLAAGSLAAAVVFYAVIHLDDDGLAAAAVELARVLRPGGVGLV